MDRRSANDDMRALYGGGLEDVLTEELRAQNNPALPTDDNHDYPVMTLKHKRRSAVLKDILKGGGYGDLAKMVSFRRGGDD